MATLLALVPAGPVRADDDDTAPDDRPHITVVGTATADVAPDLAILRLGVATETADAAAALSASAATLDAVIEAARAQGVAPSDIIKDTTSLIPVIDRRPEGAGPRFSATETIRLRLHDPAKAGTLLSALVAKGANRIDNVRYALANPEPVMARLTATAVANAKARADDAARAAGVRLGPVLQIERPETGAAADPGVLRETLVPQPGTFTTTVEVTFAIEP